MTMEAAVTSLAKVADDICSLTLARRMAALLDRPSVALAQGDPLPRGWHVLMFNPPTSQSRLRHDGAAELGFDMPDLGLPRLMMGGRKIAFLGDIPIGASVVRRSTLGSVVRKNGRSGSFALVEVEHVITLENSGQQVLTETVRYVLRPSTEGAARVKPLEIPQTIDTTHDVPENALMRTFLATEEMLFRYSAITDNPHRIHYDHPYATLVEGYPALVVNGSLPQMVLLEMFREYAGREPAGLDSRNRGPIYCGSPVYLSISKQGDCFALSARDANGALAIEATAW
ncbi:hypothetical protein N0B51_00865 [Tsuneonella sp. YG55]|uniref:FAS1-like dehydratase domain-containing protein n=1 Tax=Tsuneonella litorea TaxID=2976475 RepID=A0A9X3AK90_9SPHN|nr:hypothetical protein [Tsuneonella litorea]MCT2557523.1 hypothetical protein [Tsuneonella litorea]